MSIINDDPAAQAAADMSRGVEPIISGTPIPITVHKEEDSGPSMPEGGLKPLNNPTPHIDIEEALADDTPGTASFEGPKQEHDFSDFSSDFIEAPIDDIADDATEEKAAGKPIDIVDETPEAEDLINDNSEGAEAETETIAQEETQPEPKEEKEEVKVEPITPIEPIAPIEPITPIEPIAPIKPVAPIEPVSPTKHVNENADIEINAEHACDESNEDFFRATREKIINLRRERNECIVSADKKEDELTTIERYNSQYEITGAFDKIDRESVEKLRNEIRDIRAQADAKDRAIRSALKLVRAM